MAKLKWYDELNSQIRVILPTQKNIFIGLPRRFRAAHLRVTIEQMDIRIKNYEL